MKKPLIQIYLILHLIVILIPFALPSNTKAQIETTTVDSKATQQNYVLGPFVIGSGGVSGASSLNYLHSATSGEIVVDGIENSNNFLHSGFWYLQIFLSTGLETNEENILPTTFKLHQNFPNPFNPQTTIEYDLPQACHVTVAIFNIMGQQVCLLVDDQQQGPGITSAIWNGKDDEGRTVNSGLYLFRIEASATDSGNILFQNMKKMLVVK